MSKEDVASPTARDLQWVSKQLNVRHTVGLSLKYERWQPEGALDPTQSAHAQNSQNGLQLLFALPSINRTELELNQFDFQRYETR